MRAILALCLVACAAALSEDVTQGLEAAPAVADVTADELARKLMLAKNQVAEAKARVKKAVAAVATATANAKTAKIEAQQTKKEAEAAKAETKTRMADAKKAVDAAAKEAKINDLKQSEEMKTLKVEMQA